MGKKDRAIDKFKINEALKAVEGGDELGDISFDNVTLEQVFSTLGTIDADLFFPALEQAMKCHPKYGEAHCVDIINEMTPLLASIQPKNALELMIALQMVGAHYLSMELLNRAMRTDRVDHRNSYLNQTNKLSRTFVTLLESLNKNRNKGQQKVTVEHVHVHSGGQAVVGSIEQGGGSSNGK